MSVWPMEYMKTQLQLQKAPSATYTPPYTGVIDGLKYTVRTTGFLSLYKGLTVTLVGSIPKAGIRFGANAKCKELLLARKGPEDQKLGMAEQFLAGLGAGTIEAIFAVTPMETIKTKLIETNQNLIPGVKSIIAESGVSGLYQGLFPTIIKQSSNQGLRFMAFNKYKDIMTNDGKEKLTPIMALLGGMGAGCFSTLGNNPFDVVKTQMQGQNASKYKNSVDCFMTIFREAGIKGLYKGTIPRMGRVVPGQGVIFMSFNTIEEYTKVFFEEKK